MQLVTEELENERLGGNMLVLKDELTPWQCGFLERMTSDMAPFCSCFSFSFPSLEDLYVTVAEVGPKVWSNRPACLQPHFSDFADSPMSLRVTGQPEKLSLLLWQFAGVAGAQGTCQHPLLENENLFGSDLSVLAPFLSWWGLFPVLCYWMGTSQNLRCFFLECQLWRRQHVGSRSSKYLWWVRVKLEWWRAAEECEGKQDHEAVELEQPLSPEGWSSWISLMALHGLFCLEEGVVCLTAWQYFFPNGIIWV